MNSEKFRRHAGWRLIWTTVRAHLRWMVVSVGAGISWTGAKLAIPLLAAAAIDQGVIPGHGDKILLYSLLIVAAGVVQAVLTALRRYGAFRLGYRVEADIRERLFAHVQRLHFGFHDEIQTGQIMARAGTDVQQVRELLLMGPFVVASIFILIGVVVIMLLQNVELALLALGALPFLNLAAARFARHMGPVSYQLQTKLGDLAGVVEESVSGVRVVKGFGAEALQETRLETEAESVLGRALAASRLRSQFLPVVDFVPAVAIVAILWYGGHLVLDSKLDIGDLVAFSTYILMMVWPLRMSGMMVAAASRASTAAGRIQEVLATSAEIADPPDGVSLPAAGGGAVRFEHVRFRYGEGPMVLDGLDLTVRAGEAVAIVGRTGSGKSTIARLISRFYDVNDGTVSIDGLDVRRVKLRELRRAIGVVFEDTFLFSESVRDNIAFSDAEATMDAVRHAAMLAGAADFIDELPDGYDTMIGEHGYSLSGGQRQRIAIARALLADPRVLILDDATSSVDPSKEHEIRSALREVMTGRTTLIIAHRPATIALADRVVLVDDGVIVAEGGHEDLLASSARYREVLAQAEFRERVPLTAVEGGEPGVVR